MGYHHVQINLGPIRLTKQKAQIKLFFEPGSAIHLQKDAGYRLPGGYVFTLCNTSGAILIFFNRGLAV